MAAAVAAFTWIAYPGGQTEEVPATQRAVEVAAADPPGPALPHRIAEVMQPVAPMEAVPEAVPAPKTAVVDLAPPATPLVVQAQADDVDSVLPMPPTPPEPAKPRAAPRPARPNSLGVERVALARVLPPEGELCRRILVRAQLGEDASDAERRFMRGGCRP